MRQLLSTETEIEKCSQTNENQIPAGNTLSSGAVEGSRQDANFKPVTVSCRALTLQPRVWRWREGFAPFAPLHRRRPPADVASATSLQWRCHVGTSAHPLSSCLPLAAGHVERACVQIALASVSIGLQEVFVLEIKKNKCHIYTRDTRGSSTNPNKSPTHTDPLAQSSTSTSLWHASHHARQAGALAD